MITDKDFELANRRGRARKAKYPAAVSASFDEAAGKVVVSLMNGVDISFPPSAAQGLEGAKPSELREVEITGAGTGVHFPKLDADLHVPGLIEGLMGTPAWIAARLGSAGGRARSPAKSTASRENGRLGGRPKKTKA